MKRARSPQKEQFWKNHVLQAKKFDGSIAEYCHNQSVNFHTFKYWQKIFKQMPGSAKPATSSFVPVSVATPEISFPAQIVGGKTLPDPTWLADFIYTLQLPFNVLKSTPKKRHHDMTLRF